LLGAFIGEETVSTGVVISFWPSGVRFPGFDGDDALPSVAFGGSSTLGGFVRTFLRVGPINENAQLTYGSVVSSSTALQAFGGVINEARGLSELSLFVSVGRCSDQS
jgi:hypothetical protein